MTQPLSRGEWIGSVSAWRLRLVAISVVVWLSGAPAFAQTDTFIAGSGLWSPTQNWSLDAPPGQGNDCVLPTNSVVTSDLAGVCANFTLQSGASLTVTPGYLFVYGTSFINQSTITVGAGNGLAFSQASTSATMSGGGTINLLASSRLTGSQDTVINTNNTIQGQGYIGVYTFTNESTINANVSGAQLELSGGVNVTNTGTVQASNGGTLLLQGSGVGVPFNNSGGTIQALAGSTVMVDAFAISGGTLVSTGSGIFSTFAGSGNPGLTNLTNNANYTIVSGGSTTLSGTITNSGTIQVKGTLFIKGSVTLQGGSVPITYPGSINSLNGAATLINQSDITGSGLIGDSSLTLTNQGTGIVNANSTADPLILAGLPTNNTATLEASGGGTLQIKNTINNKGGTIEALAGSTVLLYSNTAMVSGGTLTTSGTGTFDTNSGTLDGTVNPVTNAGMFKVSQGTLSLQGTINNTGTINLNTIGYFVNLAQPTILTGSGKVIMSPGTSFLANPPTNTLTNQSTIEGAGTIGSNPMGITNSGSIIATNQTTPLVISPDGTLGFTNNGKLIVNKGCVLNVAGLFNNLSGTALTGGTYLVTGTLDLQGAIAANAANITLTGTTAQILNSFTNSNALTGLAASTATGSLSLQSGQVLTTATNFSNAGKTTIGTASGFTVGGSYTQTAGTTTVDGTLTAPKGLILQKGTLVGKGTLAAAVTSAASVTAGDSSTKPGALTVAGSYTQESTGTLNISVGGTAAGTYGQVAVSNGVSLGGTLSIKLINGFVPVIGETFNVVTGSAVTGTFSTVKGTSINSSEHFEVSYATNEVKLTVVAGP
jgi:hypothetical protein